MGNIASLQRKSLTAVVDQLTYAYTGNVLGSVADANANTVASFQLSGTTAYTYDLNGNMTHRNNTVNTANNLTNITYTYDANGNKLRKVVTGTSAINNDYISGIHYEAGVLKFMTTAEGRVVRNSATDYSYQYTLEDDLGNGRVYF